MNQTNKVNIF